jgi:hypothetical protein
MTARHVMPAILEENADKANCLLTIVEQCVHVCASIRECVHVRVLADKRCAYVLLRWYMITCESGVSSLLVRCLCAPRLLWFLDHD